MFYWLKERIRIAEEKLKLEEERKVRDEQLKTQKYIEKHNSLCKQGATNAVLQNSMTSYTKTSAAATKPMAVVNKVPTVESNLNRTFNKDTANSDSWV